MPGSTFATTITVDLDPLIEGMSTIEREQVPYAASRTVNGLALAVQDAIRKGLRERFTIRQDYAIRYGIKIPRFAKKTDQPIVAQITIPADFDYWWKFQTGEEKVPRGANLAITSSTAFPMRSAPRGKRPRDYGFDESGKGSNRTFVIESGKSPGIYSRTGPKKGDITQLFHFDQSAPTPVFDFYELARRTVAALTQAIFAKEFANAMATRRVDG